MGLWVQKFGGSSLADASKIHRAARRAIGTKLAGHRVVVVASAMGQTTDQLLELARQVTPTPSKRELDMLLATGEQVAIALVAMAINEAGQRAISLTAAQVGLISDSSHTQARIQRISRQRILRELASDRIAIIAGFQGIDDGGELTTLGRGASDTTAVALAAALGAEVCEIYTDVDGVYTADPIIVPQARKMDTISYDEMLEMASLGASVMHVRALEFGKKYRVPIHVRCSGTDEPGTMIVSAATPGLEEVVVRGATLKEDLASLVFVGAPNRAGTAAKIFDSLAQHHILVDDIIQNIYADGTLANIGLTVGAGDLPTARSAAQEVANVLGPTCCLEVHEPISKVSLIGIGMRSHWGVAQRVFQTLAAAGINIQNISTSEIVISCMVQRQDGPKALQLLHEAFALDRISRQSAVGSRQ